MEFKLKWDRRFQIYKDLYDLRSAIESLINLGYSKFRVETITSAPKKKNGK